jgi:hypothetical protein
MWGLHLGSTLWHHAYAGMSNPLRKWGNDAWRGATDHGPPHKGVEGLTAEAAEAVHREAHGLVADEIVEVKEGS